MWLDDNITNDVVTPSGFSLFRHDRVFHEVDKGKGRGVCFLLNNQWCSDMKGISKTCTSELETLSLKCRPFYLPREFQSLILTVAYVSSESNTKCAIDQLSNKSRPAKTRIQGRPKFYQHVTCATRKDAILDHCYTTIKGAYRSLKRAPLGESDHNMVHLVPAYRQQLKRQKPIKRTLPQWTKPAIERLRGCFACTDWNMFLEAEDNIDTVH